MKSLSEMLTPEDLAYISTLNECKRRQFLSTKAALLKKLAKIQSIRHTETQSR